MATLPATLNYQLIEGTFIPQVIWNRLLFLSEPCLCHHHGSESCRICKRFRWSLAGFRNAQLPDIGGWDIRSKAEGTRRISHYYCVKGIGRVQIQAMEWVLQLLYWSLKFSFSSPPLGRWDSTGGWGGAPRCQALHAVVLGTSWKPHCMCLLRHGVCFFKQFDILSRQQAGKFAFQMQYLWAPVSMWSTSAPFSNQGPDPDPSLSTLAIFAVQLPIRLSPREYKPTFLQTHLARLRTQPTIKHRLFSHRNLLLMPKQHLSLFVYFLEHEKSELITRNIFCLQCCGYDIADLSYLFSVTVVRCILKALDFLYYIPIGAVLCGTRKEIRQNVLRYTVGIKWYPRKMYKKESGWLGTWNRGREQCVTVCMHERFHWVRKGPKQDFGDGCTLQYIF